MTVMQESVGISAIDVAERAVPDKTTEELVAAMFAHGSPRARYRQLSAQAAQLERNRQYDEARRTWTQAASQALYDIDRHWCESRAHWCEQRWHRRD